MDTAEKVETVKEEKTVEAPKDEKMVEAPKDEKTVEVPKDEKMDTGEVKEVKEKKAEPEPDFQMLSNPARVLTQQVRVWHILFCYWVVCRAIASISSSGERFITDCSRR